MGGVSVGEPKEEMHEIIHFSAPLLPSDRPRYLMGIGDFVDMLAAVEAGFDMFDCIMPTRNARNGTLFTSVGRLSIKREEFKYDKACPSTQTAVVIHAGTIRADIFGISSFQGRSFRCG